MRVRKAAGSVAAAEDLAVYAKGVEKMKQRSEEDALDPIGWTYQSRMHGNPGAVPRAPSEPQDWSQCQHGTWWFLPWHRMYLLQLERIIRSLAETPDWSLPYWDYRSAGDLVIPAPFLDRASSLFDASRRLRTGIPTPPETWADQNTFVAFGGASSTQPNHLGEFPGAVEHNPHNFVHGAVGGDMAGFQSPLDPLFWIHHCNIDRLWEIWRSLDRLNPSESSWLNTTFDFPDPDPPGRRSLAVRDVASATDAGYGYDDLRVVGEPAFDIVGAMAPTSRRDDDLELLGATSTGGSVRESAEIGVSAQALADRRTVAPSDMQAAPLPLFLRLENVGMQSGDASSMWNVYVRAGGGERHLVGTIAPFGLAGLTADGGRQTLTFDISGLSSEILNNGPIEVTFEPVDEEVEGEPFWERASLYTAAG